MPLITVFTPAFNRANKIHRVFDSLMQQRVRDFEWIIVDDGSTDNTRDVIEGFISQNPFFPIRYVYQENAGKHIAINHGVRLAQGKWFYIADSDDALTDDCLQVFMDEWNRIPEEHQPAFCSIVACCRNQHGQRISDPVPADPYDGNWRDLYYRHQFRKEATNILLTHILKEYPFPENIRRTYYPEAIIWRKMSDKYKIRLISKELRIYYMENTGDSIMTKYKSYEAKALSACVETAATLNHDLRYFFSFPVHLIKSAFLYHTFKPFLSKSDQALTPLTKNAFIFTAPLLLPGLLMNRVLRWKDSKHKG